MAADKKGFILYCDLIHTFSYLTNEQKGQCIWWVLEYVNDKEPEPLEGLLQAVVEPIKHQLKRDLSKWERSLEAKSRAGKASAKARLNKSKQRSTESTRVDSVQHRSTNPTVTVTDTVTDTVIVNDNVNDSEIKGSSLPQNFKEWSIDDFKKNIIDNKNKECSNDELKDFLFYWSEENEKGKMRFQLEKTWSTSGRLRTWIKRSKQFKKQTDKPEEKISVYKHMAEELKKELYG